MLLLHLLNHLYTLSFCPQNHACFASTPCTKAPTLTPTDSPSSSPSDSPSASPTKAPWSNTAFLEFLYGEETTDGSNNQNNDGQLASDVNDKLGNVGGLQYHFFCGYSWSHADETCNRFCPTGDKAECGEGSGMECYANTRCDGRDTPPPTVSPAPSVSKGDNNTNGGTASSGTGGDVCNVCSSGKLNGATPIIVNSKSATCGDLDAILNNENVLEGAHSCDSVQAMYDEVCCLDECKLCQNADGEVSGIKDRLVEKGGYSATCEEVNTILGENRSDSTICRDAKTQLAGDCCYNQCTLCEENESTSWYAVVEFESIQSTCLGLDYLLRAENVQVGSQRCSALQSEYKSTCCYTPLPDPCQLCEADDVLYEVNTSKSVSTERASTSSCAQINDSLARLSANDQQCTEGKQSYFGKCCNLSEKLTGGDASDGGGGGDLPGAAPSDKSSTDDGYWGSGGAAWNAEEWNPPNSASHVRVPLYGGLVFFCLLFV